MVVKLAILTFWLVFSDYGGVRVSERTFQGTWQVRDLPGKREIGRDDHLNFILGQRNKMCGRSAKPEVGRGKDGSWVKIKGVAWAGVE